jgi:hypothetical protein
MSSLFHRHPQQDLVRYLDGELSARQAENVDSHLRECAACRAELQVLKDTYADCASYRQNVLAAQLPAAPEPWRDLYSDFSRIDRSLASDSLLVRLMRPLLYSGTPRWSFVAGLAVLIVLLSLNQLRQAPSVQAASLLRKAVAVSQSKPRSARRIRVRTSRHQDFTRLAGAQTALLPVSESQIVAALFQSAGFDWSDPLSARAFQEWRDRQVHKTDEVSTVTKPDAPSESLTQLRTVAAEGELAAASITFDAEDYPVAERLEFRDQEWVEVTEFAEASNGVGGHVASTVEVPARTAEPPSRLTAFAPVSSASVSDEIQVLSKLSEIEADLGDPIDVSLGDGKVKVIGDESIAPRRQEQIRAKLAGSPNVEVQFGTVPAKSLSAGIPSAPSGTPGLKPSVLQGRLEKHLGGHGEFERFSTQLLDLDDAAMQRVYALRRLAQKFPAADETQLSPVDRSALRDISRKHTAVLAEKVSAMEKMLNPALTSLGGSAAAQSVGLHNSWQPAADDVYQDARRVEVLVSQLLGMTAGEASPSELMAALKTLRANLDDCSHRLR